MTLNILGTEYTVTVKNYNEDEYFGRMECGGYCSGLTKQIVICDMHTYKGWEHDDDAMIEAQHKELLRHEIVHAFLEESGLSENSNSVDAWAQNEEMVDWIALQGQKIYQTWQKAGAL